jgi:membrane protein DedA with SNARE-associated domain
MDATSQLPLPQLSLTLAGLDAWPQYLSHYGYVALFVLALVEGPVVTIFAAFLASRGVLSVPAVYVTVVLGDLAGDAFYYAIGRWFLGKLPWFSGSRGRKLKGRMDQIGAKLRAQPGRVLLFGKLTHSAGFAVLLAAGAARMRLGGFLLYNLLGTLPKSAALVVVGYYFGRSYKAINGQMERIGLVAFVLLAGVIVFIVHRWAVSGGESKDPE